jgi:hypothetical protein
VPWKILTGQPQVRTNPERSRCSSVSSRWNRQTRPSKQAKAAKAQARCQVVEVGHGALLYRDEPHVPCSSPPKGIPGSEYLHSFPSLATAGTLLLPLELLRILIGIDPVHLFSSDPRGPLMDIRLTRIAIVAYARACSSEIVRVILASTYPLRSRPERAADIKTMSTLFILPSFVPSSLRFVNKKLASSMCAVPV